MPTNASLTLHCDDVATISVSHDSGDSWTDVGQSTQWSIPFMYNVTNVSARTVIHVNCTDAGVHAGFIATIQYNNQNYSTINPLADSVWDLLYSTDNVISPLVYHNKTAIWGIGTSEISIDAMWIWNGNNGNTMVFEFNFDKTEGLNTTTAPSMDPTWNPSFTPTDSSPAVVPVSDTGVPTMMPTGNSNDENGDNVSNLSTEPIASIDSGSVGTEESSGSSTLAIAVAVALVFALGSSVIVMLCVLKQNRKGRDRSNDQRMIGNQSPAEHVVPESPGSGPITPELEMTEGYQEEGMQETRVLPSNVTTTAGWNTLQHAGIEIGATVTPQYDNAESGDELAVALEENAITLQTMTNDDMIVTPAQPTAK